MNRGMLIAAWLLGAIVAAIAAPFAVGYLGRLACDFLVWATGDGSYSNGMLVVWVLAMASPVVAFAAVAIAGVRLDDRRAQRSAEGRAPHGFPVVSGRRPKDRRAS